MTTVYDMACNDIIINIQQQQQQQQQQQEEGVGGNGSGAIPTSPITLVCELMCCIGVL